MFPLFQWKLSEMKIHLPCWYYEWQTIIKLLCFCNRQLFCSLVILVTYNLNITCTFYLIDTEALLQHNQKIYNLSGNLHFVWCYKNSLQIKGSSTWNDFYWVGFEDKSIWYVSVLLSTYGNPGSSCNLLELNWRETPELGLTLVLHVCWPWVRGHSASNSVGLSEKDKERLASFALVIRDL